MHWPQGKGHIILKSKNRKCSICIGTKANDTLSWNQTTGNGAFALAPRQIIHYPEIKTQEMEHLHWHQGKWYIILKSKHRKCICIRQEKPHESKRTFSWPPKHAHLFTQSSAQKKSGYIYWIFIWLYKYMVRTFSCQYTGTRKDWILKKGNSNIHIKMIFSTFEKIHITNTTNNFKLFLKKGYIHFQWFYLFFR